MLIHSFIDFILKYNQKEKNGENKTERLKQQKSSQSLQLNIKPIAWLHVQDLQWKDFTAGRQFRHSRGSHTSSETILKFASPHDLKLDSLKVYFLKFA